MKKASAILKSVILLSLLLTTPFSALTSSLPNPEVNSVKNQISHPTDIPKQLAKPAIPDSLKSSITHVDATQNNEESQNYYSAAWWTVYVTGLLTFITGLLALYTGRLFQATVKLSEDSRKSYVAEHRTWIKIYPIDVGPISVNGGKIRVTITFEIEVVGLFPAVQVHVNSQPFKCRGFGIGRDHIEKLIALDIDMVKQFPATSGGYSMMPGDKKTFQFSAEAEIDAAIEAKAKEQENHGVPTKNIISTVWVAYCVIYKSLSSDEWCYTGHTLTFNMNDGQFIDLNIDGDFVSGDITAKVFDTIIS